MSHLWEPREDGDVHTVQSLQCLHQMQQTMGPVSVLISRAHGFTAVLIGGVGRPEKNENFRYSSKVTVLKVPPKAKLMEFRFLHLAARIECSIVQEVFHKEEYTQRTHHIICQHALKMAIRRDVMYPDMNVAVICSHREVRFGVVCILCESDKVALIDVNNNNGAEQRASLQNWSKLFDSPPLTPYELASPAAFRYFVFTQPVCSLNLMCEYPFSVPMTSTLLPLRICESVKSSSRGEARKSVPYLCVGCLSI